MKAFIYSPTKSAMQSGMGNTKYWLIKFDQDGSRYIDPLMGWTGSRDMLQEVKLKFDNQEEAIAFAKMNNLDFEIIEYHSRKLQPKSYTDNFIQCESCDLLEEGKPEAHNKGEAVKFAKAYSVPYKVVKPPKKRTRSKINSNNSIK
jgi:hypothetical protein